MSTHDLERELASLFNEQAEEAMNRTDTQAELQEFRARIEGAPPRGGRRWALAAAVAVAAAVAAVSLRAADLGTDRPDGGPAGNPVPDQSAAVSVAQGFVDAFTTGDVDRAASYLAPGARPWDGWRFDIFRDAAWNRDYLVEPCEVLNTSSTATRVGCQFDYYLFHSQEWGSEPFTNNLFTVSVRDGKVLWVDAAYDYANNGQAQLYESLGAWVRANHPADWAFMESQEDLPTAAERSRWRGLWEKYSRQYADDMTQ